METKTNKLRFLKPAALIFLNLILLFTAYQLIIRIRSKINQKQEIESGKYAVTSRDNFRYYYSKGFSEFYEPIPGNLDEWNPEWLGYKTENKINADALNAVNNYEIEKKPGTFRIVAMGDSFTYGLYVKSSENYPAVLENLLNKKCGKNVKYEVINLGVPGYDIDYSVNRFQIRGKKYNPDLVTWFMLDNDFEIINEKIIPLERKIREERKLDPNSREYALGNGEQTYPTWRAAIDIVNKQLTLPGILKYQKEALQKIRNITDKPIFIIIPSVFNPQYKNLILDFKKENKNVFLFDNLKLTEGTIFADGHPNVIGHKIIARDLLKFLTTNSKLKCNLK